MDRRLVGASVVMLGLGAIALAGCGGGEKGIDGRGGPDAQMVLTDSGGTCRWLIKQDTIIQRGKSFTLHLKNRCASDVTVDLGNFRTTSTTAKTDCASAVDGIQSWPFSDDQNDPSKRRETVRAGQGGNIVLHDAKHGQGPGLDEYFYDACINGARVDPRLVIE